MFSYSSSPNTPAWAANARRYVVFHHGGARPPFRPLGIQRHAAAQKSRAIASQARGRCEEDAMPKWVSFRVPSVCADVVATMIALGMGARADDCLVAPNSDPPPGARWVYQT